MGNCCLSSRKEEKLEQDPLFEKQTTKETQLEINNPMLESQNSQPKLRQSNSVPHRHKIKETMKLSKDKNDKGQKQLNDYIIEEVLGEGSFGKVKLAIKQDQYFAIKRLKKSQLKKKREYVHDKDGCKKIKQFFYLAGHFKTALDDVKKEIAIMKKMRHPNIIRLYEVIDNPNSDKIYMVMEYAKNGQLIDWDEEDQKFFIVNKKVELSIDFYRDVFRDILKGIYYMHSQNIVHRDIKPQNIIFNEKFNAKIADFGVSSIVDKEGILEDTQGTYHFMAPEQLDVVHSSHYSGKAADIWALGISFYAFLYLKIPFNGSSIDELVDNIQHQEIQIDDKQIQPFLQKLLEKDPKKRATIDDLLADPWINEGRENLKISADKEFQQIELDDQDIDNAFSITTYVKIKKWAKQWRHSEKEL